MEFCPHCRAIRRARKTTRTVQETREGQPVTLRIHTYHCAQCSRFLYKNEQVVEPEVTEAAAEEEPAPAAADDGAGEG